MKFLILIFALVYSLSVQAQPSTDIPQTSLFFSPQEVREAEKLADQTQPAGTANIRLGAVMYYGAGDWTLWLQGEKWTPQTSRDDMHIVDVTPTHVQIAWRDDNGIERDITLMPHETYQIATGKIIP